MQQATFTSYQPFAFVVVTPGFRMLQVNCRCILFRWATNGDFVAWFRQGTLRFCWLEHAERLVGTSMVWDLAKWLVTPK